MNWIKSQHLINTQDTCGRSGKAAGTEEVWDILDGNFGKELLSGNRIAIILARLDSYEKEVVQYEKYMAIAGSKKPAECRC